MRRSERRLERLVRTEPHAAFDRRPRAECPGFASARARRSSRSRDEIARAERRATSIDSERGRARVEMTETRRLKLPVMASYGFGQVGEALVTVGFNTFLLFYYNQVLGVSGTITGTALAISLVVDAVVDPMAGAISDRL